jgi:hypothetical protein
MPFELDISKLPHIPRFPEVFSGSIGSGKFYHATKIRFKRNGIWYWLILDFKYAIDNPEHQNAYLVHLKILQGLNRMAYLYSFLNEEMHKEDMEERAKDPNQYSEEMRLIKEYKGKQF